MVQVHSFSSSRYTLALAATSVSMRGSVDSDQAVLFSSESEVTAVLKSTQVSVTQKPLESPTPRQKVQPRHAHLYFCKDGVIAMTACHDVCLIRVPNSTIRQLRSCSGTFLHGVSTRFESIAGHQHLGMAETVTVPGLVHQEIVRGIAMG